MHRWIADEKQRLLVLALGLSLAAVLIDNWTARALHSRSPVWTLVVLIALVLQRSSHVTPDALAGPYFRWSWLRLVLFALLHAGMVLLGRMASTTLVTAAHSSTVTSGLIVLLKYLVLAPTLVLFPVAAWLRLGRKYAAELVAAALVLFTWNPLRIFETLWPWYSAALGRFVHVLASIFVPGLGYSPGLVPTFLGPRLDVSIIFSCGGLQGIQLFQFLFGLILVVDWNRLNKRRALFGYFAGSAAMLLANALRIALLVVLGNRVSPDLVARYHVNAGWFFFSLVFVAFLFMSYYWLLRSSGPMPRNAS